MRPLHDPEHFSEDPDPTEQWAKEMGDLIALAAAEEKYKDIAENSELLRLFAEHGWTVAMPKDDHGRIASVEIKDVSGKIQFYENIEEMRRLRSQTREN